MKRLMSDEVNLMIDDFGTDSELNLLVRHYHGLAVDYFIKKQNMRAYVHSATGVRRVA